MFLILPPHKPMVNSAIRIPGTFGNNVKIILNVTNIHKDCSLLFRIYNEGHHHPYIKHYYARYYGGNSFEIFIPEAILNHSEFIVGSQMRYSQLLELQGTESGFIDVDTDEDRMIVTYSDPFPIS